MGPTPQKSGPLAGLTVVEMAGLGPVPLAALMLSEMGAEVLRIERTDAGRPFLSLSPEYDLDRHGRTILKADLKRPEGRALMLRLLGKADVLVEGFRPGVMERLGLGPDAALAANPALVYGRMTGFGQDGPLCARAGHDITYLALSGALHAIGRQDKPLPPLNLVADYGGGTMMLVGGVLAALVECARTGKGQVVDAAMVEGAAMLTAPLHAYRAAGLWQDARGVNLLDGGAPFYDTYETADRRHVAVGCLEPQFFAEFARLLPLDERFVRSQYDRSLWQDMRAAIAGRFLLKTRDDWTKIFADSDACVAPVLSLAEAKDHPHNRARRTFANAGALERPAPAPRFSRTPSAIAGPPGDGREPLAAALARFGLTVEETEGLVSSGILVK
ncbi:MAG: CaiB/BaiF CoA transferase family protein [Mesorhizobium sp.]